MVDKGPDCRPADRRKGKGQRDDAIPHPRHSWGASDNGPVIPARSVATKEQRENAVKALRSRRVNDIVDFIKSDSLTDEDLTRLWSTLVAVRASRNVDCLVDSVTLKGDNGVEERLDPLGSLASHFDIGVALSELANLRGNSGSPLVDDLAILTLCQDAVSSSEQRDADVVTDVTADAPAASSSSSGDLQVVSKPEIRTTNKQCTETVRSSLVVRDR